MPRRNRRRGQVGEARASRFVTGVLFTLIGTGFLLDELGVWTVKLVYLWPLCIIGLGLGTVVGRAHRHRVEEGRSVQLATAEERVRIARELHDIIAHSVSLMTVQIAAARRVAERRPEAAGAALEAAERTGRESLAELRRTLSVLRSADASIEAASFREGRADEERDERAPLPGLTDLDALVTSWREAGMDVNLEVQGRPPSTTPSVELAVFRVVQEALTNCTRHAPRANVGVWVDYTPDLIEVSVEDDGDAEAAQPASLLSAPRPSDAPGHGLLGMQERVAAVGGTLDAGPNPLGKGWRVRARIPVASP